MLGVAVGSVIARYAPADLFKGVFVVVAGYDPKLACGIICASGTLGQIIPPSTVLIFMGDILQGANAQAQMALGTKRGILASFLAAVRVDPTSAIVRTAVLPAGRYCRQRFLVLP